MTWQEALSQYYETHPTLNDANRAWLQKKVLLEAPLLEELERQELIARFTVDGTMNHTLLVATLVWQMLGKILAGEEEPINGNLRSFWYQIADPLYLRKDLYTTVKGTPGFEAYLVELEALAEHDDESRSKLADSSTIKVSYCKDLCEDVIQSFVLQAIFRYRGPFQFVDPHPNLHLLGEGRASFIFFCEKAGFWQKYCEKIYQKHAITVIASKGFPSLLCLEYVADELRAKKIKNVALAGLVDYEPAGFLIAKDYQDKFSWLGFGIKNFTLLTSTSLFTQNSLDTKYRDLTHVHPSREKITQAWFELTGGIDGKRRGIQADHASAPRVFKAVEAWYKCMIRGWEDT